MNNSRKRNISKGTTKGKLAAAKKGYFIGSVPPFGYKKWKRDGTAGMNPRILQIDDNTAQAVLDSFESICNIRGLDRKSTRLNSSHPTTSRMPSSA